MRAHDLLALAVLASACGSPPPTSDAAAPIDTGPDFCADDSECDDTVFCNGRELCRPGAAHADVRGCLGARAGACAASQTCDEMHDRCVTNCDVTPDADGDGVPAITCGGTDCDDADPDRFPGNAEVCDGARHDEDCDAATYGARDRDGDGATDAQCCNVAMDGSLRCGTDCDDRDGTIAPGAVERCDRRDQDCDGTADEGVMVAAFADADRDLHGNASAPLLGCPGLPGVVLTSDDCDDTRGAVYTGAPEICDGRDDDCDTHVDESATPVTWYRDLDGDGFGSATSGTTVACVPPAGYSLFSTDCDDTRRTTSPLSREACNGIDDDCSGFPDFPIAPGDFEDDDRDGFADTRCGGMAGDCDDLDPDVHPGAPELCNRRDDDCDGAIETGATALAWYPDRDGDGAGENGSVPVYSCDVVEGRTRATGDCDDHSAAIGPLALDACGTGVDGFDDDCDGTIDEAGGESAFYVDHDGDGYGAGTPTLACTMPTSSLPRGGDCDDTRAAVHPGLVETCAVLDGIDDDCDGLVDCLDPDCAGAAACGPPVSLALASGAGQSAYPGFPLPEAIVVLATSRAGTPMPGAIVHFAASAGAIVTDETVVSDTAGLARTYARVGLGLGPYTITASANGASPLVVSETAVAAPDGTWLPMIDAQRLGSPGSGPTGLIEGASAIGARPHATPPTDAMRFVSIGALHGLVVPLPSDHCVVSIDAGGVLHVVAGQCGTGGIDPADEEGPARAALLSAPSAIALDATGHRLFVADTGNQRVRVIALDDGTIATIAGGGLENVPAIDQTLPASALRLPATRLAYDPVVDELWLAVAGACVRIPTATLAATTVSLCPPDRPHPGLMVTGTTLLGRAPIGTSDAMPPLPSLPTIVTTPFGYVGLAPFGTPIDARLPPTGTMAGHVVGPLGRTSDTGTYASLGPIVGTFGMDVWVHPELGSSHLTIQSSAAPGTVVTAITNTPTQNWFVGGGSHVVTLREGVAFSSDADGELVYVGPDRLEVLQRITGGGGFPQIFSATSTTYGRIPYTPTGSRYEEVTLDGTVVRTEIFAGGSPTWVFTAADGSLYLRLSQTDPSGISTAAIERRVVGSAPVSLDDLVTDPPSVSVANLTSFVVDASGALWMIGSLPADGTVGLVRRHPDGTHEDIPFLLTGTTPPYGARSFVALAPDGTIVVLASSLYRIDPTTLAVTTVPTSGSTFDSASGLLVDAHGHYWIQQGPTTSVVW